MLRGYQASLLREVEAGLEESSRVLMVLPTGGGKTKIACEVVKTWLARGRKVLWLCHRRELAEQAMASLALLSLSPQRLGVGKRQKLRRLVVSTIQLWSRAYAVEAWRPDFVVCDEAHHVPARSWLTALEEARPEGVLGMTATPQRVDGRGLGAAFEVLVEGPSVKALVKDGWLARPRVWVPYTPDLTGVRKQAGDWVRSGVERVMRQRTVMGDIVRHYSDRLSGRRAIAFCATVRHANELAVELADFGIPAAALSAKTRRQDREGILQGLKEGSLHVVCSCDVISEGIDIPAVDGAILARPTASLSVFLQQVGRALRPSGGPGSGGEAIILDHAGNSLRHGLPLDDREWVLDSTETRRASPAAVRVCQDCLAAYRSTLTRCPECGAAAPPPKVRKPVSIRDSEMRELSGLDPHERTLRTMPLKEALRLCRTPDSVRELGRLRGYRPGWAREVLRFRASTVRRAWKCR